MVGFTVPGRTAALYPVGDRSQARVVLLWRTPRLHDYDRHDREAQRRLLRNLYGDLGWEVPRLLTELDQAEDLYLDSISQVVMKAWTIGRVLVGDAGYSPALRSAAGPAWRSSGLTCSPVNSLRLAAITFGASPHISRPSNP